MNIQFNFINQSNDVNNTTVVIFQKNLAAPPNSPAIAWLLINNCGTGDNHPFVFPTQYYINASDSYGNYTTQLPAQPGKLFKVSKTPAGNRLVFAGAATNRTLIQVKNNLPQGAINANVFKAGKLFATQSSLAPGQTAGFRFAPELWIDAVSMVVEGQLMNSSILSNINTKFNITGIASADIVMTGGPTIANPLNPFVFNLANVVMA